MTSNEEQSKTEASAPVRAPEAPTKANVAPQKPRVAPSKPKSNKKATPAKKRTKARKGANRAKSAVAREGTKATKVLTLLRRPNGATLKELMKATNWQPHSVRGFLSGTIGKKLGLAVSSVKGEDGERTYSVRG